MSGYQVMPELSPEKYQELRDSIINNGILIPIEADENGNIIDGYHRSQIAKELGIECPSNTKHYKNENAKFEAAITLNADRRGGLSREEKQELIKRYIKASPNKSSRQIADTLKVDHKTVETQKRKLETDGEIPQQETIQTKDGKVRSRIPKPETEIVSRNECKDVAHINIGGLSIETPIYEDGFMDHYIYECGQLDSLMSRTREERHLTDNAIATTVLRVLECIKNNEVWEMRKFSAGIFAEIIKLTEFLHRLEELRRFSKTEGSALEYLLHCTCNTGDDIRENRYKLIKIILDEDEERDGE